jgi:ammonia channel protein AmtB
LIATGVFMMSTAAEMGAMGPLIIALSFYVVFAAIAIEVILGAFALTRKLAGVGLRRYP